ncbi:MAG: MBL fold metallo-hydrolase [Lachnospiraceae bacterium]|nr:MBL fold metallo-hydrolase [Lachnospiraceae bacterium]
MHQFFSSKKISEHLHIIYESYCDTSSLTLGLAVGEKYAALIDSGLGAVDGLRSHVETLTDKPVLCLVTHGHPDHAGGAVQFDRIYMNALDEPELKWGLTKERRLGDLVDFSDNDQEVLDYAKEHCVDCTDFHYENMEDGMKFDLGGVTLEVLAMPGHTSGSVAILNRQEHYIFTGDAVSETLMLTGYERERIESSRRGLSRMVSICSEMKNPVIWAAHYAEPVPLQQAVDLRDACSDILNGDVANDTRTHFKFAEINDPNIVLYKHIKNSVAVTYNEVVVRKRTPLSID